MALRRSAAALALLAVLAFAASAQGSPEREAHLKHQQVAEANPRATFNEWIASFEKAYAQNVEEYEHRFAVWMDNLKFIIDYNSKYTSHWLGLNKFADWTHEEFKRHSLGYRPDLRKNSNRLVGAQPFRFAATSPPNSIDWREKNAVTAVKNQQQCGSCWAFSTTGSVEGVNAIYTGELTTLSEQELVDCDTAQDHGCEGGLMDFAFDFIIENGGIDTEDDYPYLAADGACAKKKLHRHMVSIDGYEDVPANDEDALLKAVANQPISVAIEADEREFQLYAGGVFDAPCGTALDHGVLVVGYGSEPNVNGTEQPYWLVKNSWGPEWGDAGYIKLVRGLSNAPQGQCGVAMQASFPTKDSPNPPPSPPSPPEPPAPPGPQPIVCDETTTCPDGSTCCCLRDFFGYCFTWACCPLPEATCCDDLTHCCPRELPVCDTDAGRCLKGEGMGFKGSVPWVTKVPATRSTWGRDWIPRLPAVPAWAETAVHRIEELVGAEEEVEDNLLESSVSEFLTAES